MNQLQKLGRSMMLPVASLPVAALLMGFGYWIDPTGWGANNVLAAFLIKSGGALIDNMGVIFAVGIAVGLSNNNDGTGGLAGLISWLVFQTVLSVGAVAMFTKIPADDVNVAFTKVNSQFFGILAGVIGGMTYNRFKDIRLPDFLSFFSGKRFVAIATTVFTLCASVVLFFIWPVVYTGLVKFGEGIINLGALGAGIYAFLNRLLIPIGLHHALNSVFWFDVANISDIARFWGSQPLLTETINGVSVTGIYMTGFFPIMMFGLPGAALAMYHTAKSNRQKTVAGLLGAAALASFFTGVTEPLEFSFMFLAPVLYVIHAALTGIFVMVSALLPIRAGFNFSAGFVDWFLSFNAPGRMNPLYLLGLGVIAFVAYYVIFRFLIVKFNIKTPGREDDVVEEEIVVTDVGYADNAAIILEAMGGKDNILDTTYCVTRLRLEIADTDKISEETLKKAKTAGFVKTGKNSVQVIIGPQVQFLAEEFLKLVKK